MLPSATPPDPNISETYDQREGNRRTHTRSPRTSAHVERLVLVVLHRTRGDVLDRRLVSADEHDVRHEHRRCEHPKQTRSACAPRY